MATAPELLKRAAEIMEERGKQYDKPDGERSMAKTVAAFNIITGKDLTEQEGWLLMQVLKDVRQWQTPNKAHPDSLEDCIAYAALKAEAFIDVPVIDETMQQNTVAWFDWAGGDCPVLHDTRVDVVYRDLSIKSVEGRAAGIYRWNHKKSENDCYDADFDIVKYRIHKEDK